MIRYFLIIVGVALLSSALGGGFGALVSAISSDFVRGLFALEQEVSATRYAIATGMIWGLFLGTAVGVCSAFLAVLARLVKTRPR